MELLDIPFHVNPFPQNIVQSEIADWLLCLWDKEL
jgi:hypothetical protein